MDPSKDDLKAMEKNDSVGDSDRTTILSLSNILRTLTNDHQNNIILRENALLRQEIQGMRIELSELRMENLRIKSEALETEERNENLQFISEITRTSKASMDTKMKIRQFKSERSDTIGAIVEQKMENTSKASMEPKIENLKSEIPDSTKATMEPKTEKSDTSKAIMEQTLEMKSEVPVTNKVIGHTVKAKSNQELQEDFKKLLIENIRNFLNYQEQKVIVNFKMFENIFSCFLNDADFMQQMKNFDSKFSDILSNRFQFLYQNHILMMNQRIHQAEQQRRQKLFEHFRTGMQMENWAQRLEMQLASMKLISELRSVVLKLAAKKDHNALLQALQNLENKLKKDD